MFKTIASLALLVACIPSVDAARPTVRFPPCDGQRINFVPLGPEMVASPFIIGHSYVGEESKKIGNIISTGHCRIVVDAPSGIHQGTATIGLSPVIGSLASFGVATLPEWPTVASPGQEVAYTLSFDMASLTPAKDDWLDLVQLDFKRSDSLSSNAGFSTVYRLRKTSGDGGATVILIESRATQSASADKPEITDRIVATLPTNGDGISSHYIALRWTQKAEEYPVDSDGETQAPTVETSVQLLDANGTPLYTKVLIDEFANSFSMGLLNHHTMATVYPSDSVIEFSNAALSAQTAP